MWIPFHNELDETFRGDRSVWLKMGGGAVVVAFIVLVTTLREARQGELPRDLTRPVIVGLALGSAAFGALLGLMLALKDTVRHRLDRGDRVTFLLRLYFGMGAWSLLAWVPTAFVLAIAITIATI